ncbi:hypothetical protein DM46_2446 [Burkholderia mallei]|nr:hypothetical protein DM46_2446 [Burkholderia mallei]
MRRSAALPGTTQCTNSALAVQGGKRATCGRAPRSGLTRGA